MNHADVSRGAGVRATIEGSLRIVADFTRAMERDGRIEPALEDLAGLMGADAAIVTRLGSSGARRLSAWERDAGKMFTPRNRPPLASDLIALAGPSLRSGSVLVLSDILDPEQLRDLAGRRHLETWSIGDVVFVMLSNVRGAADVLELQFSSRFGMHNMALLNSIGQMLASLWRDRVATVKSIGVVATAQKRRPEAVDILSVDNPIRLSRAEYRVCQLVRAGHRAGEIADELDLQECTVRSHLRSIYAKANVSGQVGLMYLLSDEDRRRAVAGWRR
jgi:DNA-binding CsgD family transcriptional regulator